MCSIAIQWNFIILIYFETLYATTKAENMSVLSDISQCPKISISQYPKIYGGCSLREVDRMEILRHQQMSSLLMCAEGVQPLTMLRFTFDHPRLRLQPIMGLGSNIRLDSGCPCVFALEILRRQKYHRSRCMRKVFSLLLLTQGWDLLLPFGGLEPIMVPISGLTQSQGARPAPPTTNKPAAQTPTPSVEPASSLLLLSFLVFLGKLLQEKGRRG